MADAAFPSAFLFQSLKVLRGYARRTQKQNLTANTTFLPNGQMQLELPANALIDLDSLCIHSRISYAAKPVLRYQCWPPTVGAFIQNVTVMINGEAFQVTDYVGDLQVVLTDFSYGDAVKRRMGLQQLGNVNKYRCSTTANMPNIFPATVDYVDTGTRDIILTAADLPGWLSSVQPRVLNTALMGPVQINLVLKGPDILGQGLGAGSVYVLTHADNQQAVQNPAIAAAAGTPAIPASTNLPGTMFDAANERDGSYRDMPGDQPAAAGEPPGTYQWNNVIATMDVLSMPPEFAQLNNMVLASGNQFTCPYHNWTVIPNAIGGSFSRTHRFSIATSCLDLVVSWFNPNQNVEQRFFDHISRRSRQWHRVMPATYQFLVGGTLYPTWPPDRKDSWPVFLTSIGKLHDATHEFHPGLTSMREWEEKFGVMIYRFNVLDGAGKEWYSGLNTVNSAIQCTLTTTAVPNDPAVPLKPGTDTSLLPGVGTQFVAMKTTKIMSIAANKATSQLQ
jgi:hypothetical protein